MASSVSRQATLLDVFEGSPKCGLVFPSEVTMTSLDPLERVVSTLARDPNLPRVKKLLYCACYGVWEDSPERLNQVSLQEVVQGVWERSPTLEALQFQLNRVVKTLNKPVAYAHVANGVLQVLNDLYFDTYNITQPVMVNRVQVPLQMTGSPVAGNLPLANAGAAQPAAEQGQYGDAGATPQGYLGPQHSHHAGSNAAANPSLNSGLPPGPPQSYSSAYGMQSGHGTTAPYLGASQPVPYANGTPGQPPQAFSQAAPVGYEQPGQPSAGQPPIGQPQAEYAQESQGDSPATQWFVGGQDSAASSLTPAQLSAQTAVRSHVLQSLAQHQEQRRMKKLLVCVCHNQWENNRSHLAALDWELLLDETRRLMPTLPGLEQVLQAIVNSLSKPVEYLRVAKLLLETITPLYEQERPDETQFFGVTPEPSARDLEPGAGHAVGRFAGPSHAGPTYPANSSSNFRAPSPQAGVIGIGHYAAQPARRASDDALANPPSSGVFDEGPTTGLFKPQLPVSPMDSRYPPRALPHDDGRGDIQIESAVAMTPQLVGEDTAVHAMAGQDGMGIYKDARPREANESQDSPGDGVGEFSKDAVESDDFTLRLSLMRYANPLMAKAVMFSALYRLFRFSEQDWIELRRHNLASLIAELEERYPNLIDLEMKLCGVAEQLEVPEQAMQTVAALLKVLKPRYESVKQSPARDMGLASASESSGGSASASVATASGSISAAAIAPEVAKSTAAPGGVPGLPTEQATAIQFGPEGGDGNHGAVISAEAGGAIAPPISTPKTSDSPASDLEPSDSQQAVIAEVLPSDEDSFEAMNSGDLEADLALLAASLEDDGHSLNHES